MSEVQVLALSGGVGGAKLALGFDRALPAGALACLVNTGDDFQHLGLHVSPDLDTVLYTLAGCNNVETGWGRRDETWTFMSVLGQLGGPTWFRLGDGDLALHVERTRRLAGGEALSAIMDDVRRRLGVASQLLPMSDSPVRTIVHTNEGELAFQDYFVARRAEPEVRALEFRGAASAATTPAVLGAVASSRLQAIVICPSNPYLSVAPILALPGLRQALKRRGVPIVGVCPLVGGRAVKGPTAKLMVELGHEVTPRGIVEYYDGLLDGLIIDAMDRDWDGRCGVHTRVAQTLMRSEHDSVALAEGVLTFAAELKTRGI